MGVQTSDLHNTKIPPILYYFFGRRVVCAVRKPRLYILCFEGGLVSPIWRICSSNKNVPAKVFFTSRLLKNEEIICIFVFSG